jgi:hypothetical protein
MPRKVKAVDGDTLCGLALKGGFLNCDPLRALPANDDFKSRPLRKGDVVTLPDRKAKEASGKTGGTTKVVVSAGYPPRLRFVHGSKGLPMAQDPTLTCLEISNFVTSKAGKTMGAAFPANFGFDEDGHVDPDAFKVEVKLSGAGDKVKVLLEALRPVYRANGTVERHEPFTGAEHDKRKLEVECERANAASTFYRSAYLRLVTDDVDQAAAQKQALLITDMADGQDGDEDRVEILDQRVRGSTEVPVCKAPAADRCRVRAELPVGNERRRVRLCVRVFRKKAGEPAVVAGLDEKMVRRRIRKWFRRAYAQACLAPRIVAPGVEFIDPPSADMLVLGEGTGLRTTGLDGGGTPSTLSFTLGKPPGGSPAPPGAPPDPTVTVALLPGMTPRMVAGGVVGALPAGFSAHTFPNPRSFSAADPSCDVIISKDDGTRVMIRNEATTDTRLTVTVARVNLASVNAATPNVMPANPDMRRILRAAETRDDRLDYFVIEKYSNPKLRGRAFVPGRDLALPFRPGPSLRWAVIMAADSSDGKVMDGGDNLPFTFPHEGGHVLTDAFHTDGANSATEMMTGSGTSIANDVAASKRICDTVHVTYGVFDPAQPTPGAAIMLAISAVARVRSRGASVMEHW